MTGSILLGIVCGIPIGASLAILCCRRKDGDKMTTPGPGGESEYSDMKTMPHHPMSEPRNSLGEADYRNPLNAGSGNPYTEVVHPPRHATADRPGAGSPGY